MRELASSLSAWREYPQFIVCRGKIPINPISGDATNPHDPNNWMSAEAAYTYANTFGAGVGFVFTDSDPFWFLDIDKAWDGQRWNEISHQLMSVFSGAATEVSTSGTGLHIFGCGNIQEHAKKNKSFGIEFYSSERFVLLTDEQASGNVWLDWSHQIDWLIGTYFRSNENTTSSESWNEGPVAEWNGPTDDDVLLGKMFGSVGSTSSIFGGRASVADLYAGNVSILESHYPAINPDSDCVYDRSSVDAALASHLAFWTGKDHSRIERLMRRSALVRDKWDKHRGYLRMTIQNAVAACQNVYSSGYSGDDTAAPETVPTADPATSTDTLAPIMTTGVQFMSTTQQLDYFKDCVYVKRNHAVLIPNGTLMKPEVFKASYAGYTFAVDAQNDKTTKNAWEAFIDNQAIRFPRVDGTCFRPNVEPRAIVCEESLDLVNTYVPIDVPRMVGDASLFIDHMVKLIPNKGDRDVILAYMAALVQNPGVKFQWCPIIQGAEGNGKTVLSRVVERAIGSRYTHYPNAADLAGGGLKFNGWIEGRLFIGLEEIFVSDRRELTEPLKVYITNDRIEIQYKGRDQYTGDNLANFMMFSNHKDCMRMTYDTRRYFMVFSGQQSVKDLMSCGMGAEYFKRLYDWLKFENGYAIVAEYLMTYQIPDILNPAGKCQRAPQSSSIHEAVESSRGIVEQNLIEYIEEEKPGFRGGYVSSKAFEDLLVTIRYDSRISPYRRKQILEEMGYERHPWLRNGRVDNPVLAEGKKIILYTNHDLSGLTRMSPSWVKEDYERKQGYIL
jgi:hypothetical protein